MEPLDQLFQINKQILSNHYSLVYDYIRTLEPAKILIIGPENRKVCEGILQNHYPRVHRNYLQRNMKLTSKFKESTVFVIQVLRTQSRGCQEVKDLFLDPTTTVICCVESPTDLAPEVRRYVDNIVIAGELTDFVRDKLNLCFGNLMG